MSRRGGRIAAALAVVAAVFAVVVAPAASAQEGAKDGLLTVRGVDGTDAEAVRVTFLWTGAPSALENLTIRENGDERKIDSLTDLRKTDQDMGTAVVLDLSGSMADRGKLTQAKEAVEAFAAEMPDGDQLAIVGFHNTVSVESAFTSDRDQIGDALAGMTAPRDGKSAIHDGLRRANQLFETRPDLQPNVLLITDGADDVSSTSFEGARASLAASGAALFAVELGGDGKVDSGSIRTMIDRAGGASFPGGSEAEIAKAFTDVTQAMRSQFVATYASGVDQGAVDLSVAVGSTETAATYVAGSDVQGAAAAAVEPKDQAFGPSWLRGSTGQLIALVLVGLAVGLGAYAFAALATKSDEGLDSVLLPYTDGAAAAEESDGALAQTALLQRAVNMTEDFAKRQGFLEKVERLLERADLPLRAAEALFFYFAAVVVLGLLGVLLLGLVPGLVIVGLVALLPPAVLNFMADRRSKAFVGQLPDMLQLLSGSLRAGYSLMQGIEAVSQEVSEPMGKELRRVVTEARLGRDIEDAMDSVAERMESPDFAWAVMAVRIQREVGGNLAELLMTVAETMVQRDRLRRDIASLTAEGRISAIILGILPIGLGLFMWSTSREYMEPLFNTGMGQFMLGGAVVSGLIGFAWMKKTITIEI